MNQLTNQSFFLSSGGTWISVTGSTEWQQSFAYVQPGSHNLYHLDPSVTFLAMATGTERYNSYAFSAGTRLAQINAVSSFGCVKILDLDLVVSSWLYQNTRS